MNNQQERISLEYFKDHFQEVWSQCGRGREYVIEGDFELIEMKSIKDDRYTSCLLYTSPSPRDRG